jgi:predicted transcriptional regulator
MTSTTSVKLPPELKTRLGKVARKTGRSAHSVIIEAVERHTAYEERMQTFIEDAKAADAEIEATGEVYAAADVHRWLDQVAHRRKARRPKPCRK